MNKKINKAVQNILKINNAIVTKKEEIKTLQTKRYNNEQWLKSIFKDKYQDKIVDCYWYGDPKDECYVIFTTSKKDAMEIVKEVEASSYKIDEVVCNIHVLSLYL